jgi:hypothetical protein
MSLAFNSGNSAEKPDNSLEFFSARKPASSVLSYQFNMKFPKNIDHPWRYFVADGDSLVKLQNILDDAKNIDATRAALAKEVGAESYDGYGFTFKDADADPIVPSIKLRMRGKEEFVCEATAPGDFVPELERGYGVDVKKKMLRIETLPAEQAQPARDALAREAGAASFDGKVFRFKDWDKNVEAVPPSRERKFRLKSNPAFVREEHADGFVPDWSTDEGFRIAEKIGEIASHVYPEKRFSAWLETFALDISLSGRSERDRKQAEVENIKGEWIIKVPVTVEGIFGADGKGGVRTGEKEGWVLPPGAKPIAVSEYFAKLENSGSLRSLPDAPRP